MSFESIPYRLAGVARANRRRPDVRAGARRVFARPELLGVLVLAAVLNLWDLSINGAANTFYAGAVKSMAGSWHDFLYNAMDRSGLMTVDKPPLSDWIQALSVRVFGYSSWSMLVPQAVMGIIAAGLMYDLVRRHFGRVGGFAAGVALATTPTIVAVSRHNNPDELLVMLSVAAVWCALRALDTGRTRWLVWTGVMVGLGFETKMGVALLLVPAIVTAWVWVRWQPGPRFGARGPAAWAGAIRPNLRMFRQLVWGGAALTVTGLAWPVLVWLTPAAQRPWISGTSDNSIWSLIVGYNGLGRISGQTGGPGGAGGGPGGGANSLFGGGTGVFRLIGSSLGDQAGWLLGFALVVLLALIALTRLRRRDVRTGFLIVVGGTLLTVGVVFSFASGIFHPYYVSMVAPWAAALIGAGVGEMLPRPLGIAGSLSSARIVGALALIGGAATELVVLHQTEGRLSWAQPLVIVMGIGGGLVLLLSLPGRIRSVVVAVAVAALLAAPATWATETLGYATNGTFPTGGPEIAQVGGFGAPGGGGVAGRRGAPGGQGGFFGLFGRAGGGGPGRLRSGPGRLRGGPPGRGFAAGDTGGGFAGGIGRGIGGGFGGGFGAGQSAAELDAAARYASAHGGGTVAVESQSTAAQSIVDGYSNVAGIGGFSGRESSVTAQWIATMVRQGRLRYILGGGSGGFTLPGDTRTGSASTIALAERLATKVTFSYDGQSVTMYDLKGKAGAILAAAGRG